MTDRGEKWWVQVKETVTPLEKGKQRPKRVTPVPVVSTLDLHGMTVQQAYEATMAFISSTKLKSVLIITGKSGQIRQEFTQWLEKLSKVRSATEINSGGAYEIVLGSRRKTRSQSPE